MCFVLAYNVCVRGFFSSIFVCVWFCLFSTVFLLICFGFDPWMTEKIECDGVRMVRCERGQILRT